MFCSLLLRTAIPAFSHCVTSALCAHARTVCVTISYNICKIRFSEAYFAGTGYDSHNTGSTAENAKRYIPGTDANRESRYEQGQGGQGWSARADTGRHRDSGYNADNQGRCLYCLPPTCQHVADLYQNQHLKYIGLHPTQLPSTHCLQC